MLYDIVFSLICGSLIDLLMENLESKFFFYLGEWNNTPSLKKSCTYMLL